MNRISSAAAGKGWNPMSRDGSGADIRAGRPGVLMVGPWPPTVGGVTTFMCNVTRSALNRTYEFIPFTTSRPGKRNLKRDNYGYRAVLQGGMKRVLQGVLITLWHLMLFPGTIVLRRPSIVQVQASDFHAFWEAALYVVMAKMFRRPVLLRIGGAFDGFYESSGTRARAAIRWTLRQPTLLIVQSLYWKDYVSRLGRTDDVIVLNNFVSERLVVERETPRPAPVRFLLCCTERPSSRGAYVLLDALKMLVAREVHAAVTLMAVPAPLRTEIEARGLAPHVALLDFLPHEEALAALRRSDVLLQISDAEGFPNTLVEAMALGCAAIVTPVGAIPEIVGSDGECAFIIPVGDAAALADRMARMASDPGTVARMATAAQARVLDRFTEARVTSILDRAYQQVLRDCIKQRSRTKRAR